MNYFPSTLLHLYATGTLHHIILEKMKDKQQYNKVKAHPHHQLLAMPTTTLRILAKAQGLPTHQTSNDCDVGKLPLVLTFPITASQCMTNNSGASACLTFSNIQTKNSAKSNKSTKFNECKQKSTIPLVIV
eukprot:scaffold128984_cov73-Attheya_sp.AAC.2